MLLVAVVSGVCCGILTGLVPGLHVNLVALLMVAAAPSLQQPVAWTAVAIISCAITHSFLDSIPSVYLGAPDPAEALNVLPGHRLLHSGRGHQAVLFTLVGSFFSLLVGLLLFPLFLISMKPIYHAIEDWVGFLLVGVMIYMLLREDSFEKKLWVLLFILLSGAIGIMVLETHLLKEPLFHLFSGLFGMSVLIPSVMQSSYLPPQDPSLASPVSRGIYARTVSAATGVGLVAAFLPGLGSSQAAILATQVVGDVGDEGFLTLVGGINTANMLLSLCSAYLLDKARNGAVVAVKDLLGTLGFELLLIFLAAALIAGGCATCLGVYLSRRCCILMQRLPYAWIVGAIILLLCSISFAFDGVYGFIVLCTTSSVGYLAQHKGIGRNHLMACLIIPVACYLLL